MIPRGIVQLALLALGVALLAAAIASGVWNGLAFLSLITFLSFIATTWEPST